MVGNVAAIRQIVEQEGADALVRVEERHGGKAAGNSVLIYAAAYSHLEVVKYLRSVLDDRGYEELLQRSDGFTALMFACCNGERLEVVEWLLSDERHFPLALMTSQDGSFHAWTALHYAANSGATAIVRLLCARCPALLLMKTTDGRTAAQVARTNGKTETAELLEQLERHPVPPPPAAPAGEL